MKKRVLLTSCSLASGFVLTAALYAASAPAITSNAVTSNATATKNSTQSVARIVPDTPAIDAEWRVLSALKVTPTISAQAQKVPALRQAAQAAEATRLQDVARQAKEFHTRNPNSPNAAKAKKLEAVASLQGVVLGNVAQEASALATATTFRQDKVQLREDRFEVALLADRYKLGKTLGGKDARQKPQEFEKLADNLRKEFGDIPEVFALYSGIAHSATTAEANRIATKILEMRPPPHIKAEAEAITSRYGLLGRPLSLWLTATDGRRIETRPAAPLPGPTVIYVWGPGADASTNPFSPLAAHAKKKTAPNVRWIYLAMGATPARVTTAAAKAPFAGVHCLEPAGVAGTVAQRLKIRTTPTVFVLNAKGELTGYGRPEEAFDLIAAATR